MEDLSTNIDVIVRDRIRLMSRCIAVVVGSSDRLEMWWSLISQILEDQSDVNVLKSMCAHRA